MTTNESKYENYCSYTEIDHIVSKFLKVQDPVTSAVRDMNYLYNYSEICAVIPRSLRENMALSYGAIMFDNFCKYHRYQLDDEGVNEEEHRSDLVQYFANLILIEAGYQQIGG